MPNEQLSPKLLAVINEAVERAVAATRIAQATEAKDYYKQTERRLYAYPHLLEKVQDDIARLTDLEAGILQKKSKSLVRFSPSGVRVDPEEMAEAMMNDLRAHMAMDKQEVETIQKALKSIERDTYFATVLARYFDGRADWEVAEELHCDESTVRRNRARLVRIVAIRIFGAPAM
ncbi:MAG: hypothetical protein VB104_07425 [Candidatus Limiplasma sp.]|nr:hypothetical protein [Candidatus Limiplasma sp.]